MTKPIISQEYLKSILDYDPDTGDFTWLVDRGKNKLIGKVAGANSNGYQYIRIKTVAYYSHRLAWLYVYGYIPKEIDHINHNKDDNRIINLREVSHSQNHKNKKLHTNNVLGIQGIYWDTVNNKWHVRINTNKKGKHIGRYKCFFDACCARKSAEIKYNYHENHG